MCNNNNLCNCFSGNNWWWIIILLLLFCNCGGGCGNAVPYYNNGGCGCLPLITITLVGVILLSVMLPLINIMKVMG